MASSEITQLEAELASVFGFEHCALFGRARSGLVTLLRIIASDPGTPILMPSNICPVVYTSANVAGLTVQLAPVDPEIGLTDDAEFAHRILASDRPGVVMPANLYGFVQGYAATNRAAREKGWFVLENDTSATKAKTHGGGDYSVHGDALLVSFGNDKPIEAGQGGAILSDDVSLVAELRRMASTYPPLDTAAKERENWTLSFRRHLRKGADGYPGIMGLSENLLPWEKRDLCHSFPERETDRLRKALHDLPGEAEKRRRLADRWRLLLSAYKDSIHCIELPQAKSLFSRANHQCILMVPWAVMIIRVVNHQIK